MHRYCLRQLGSSADAEDAVQTTFLHALRALQRDVAPECVEAWLTVIARNVCHTHRRTLGRRGALASDVDLDAIAGRPADDCDAEAAGQRNVQGDGPHCGRRRHRGRHCARARDIAPVTRGPGACSGRAADKPEREQERERERDDCSTADREGSSRKRRSPNGDTPDHARSLDHGPRTRRTRGRCERGAPPLTRLSRLRTAPPEADAPVPVIPIVPPPILELHRSHSPRYR